MTWFDRHCLLAYPIKIRVEPRKNRGVTCRMLRGDATTYEKASTIIQPVHRECKPVRNVKMDCEKMYDPGYPMNRPDTTLPNPIVASSRFISSVDSPMSKKIAVMSKHEPNDTTKANPTHIGKMDLIKSQRTREKSTSENSSFTGTGGATSEGQRD